MITYKCDAHSLVHELYAYAEDKYGHSVSRGSFHIIERGGVFGFDQDSLPSWVSPICSTLGAKHQRDILVGSVLSAVDHDLVCEQCYRELQRIIGTMREE